MKVDGIELEVGASMDEIDAVVESGLLSDGKDQSK